MAGSAALEAFCRAISVPGVEITRDAGMLATFAADVSGRRGATPLALVRLCAVAQVQIVVQAAQTNGISLIPISSGAGPRRRGDTISDTASVIVDLSGIGQVMHVDGRNAIALIEAGVTFSSLTTALKPHGLRPYRPLMPRASKSVLAAFLEREPITVPGKHWDSADPLAAMEVVFGNGELFRTGNASMSGDLKDHLEAGNRQMYSLGPSHTDFARVLQGAQGALGIVTWASMYCQPVPALELPLFASSDRLEPVVELAYRLLRRRIDGQLFILNNVHLALLLARDVAEFDQLKTVLPPWTLYLELTAPGYFPEESIAYQRALLEADAARLQVRLTTELGGRPVSDVVARQAAVIEQAADWRTNHPSQEVFCISQLDRMTPHIAEVTGDVECAVYLQPMTQGVNAHCQFTFLGATGQAEMLGGMARRAAEKCAESGGFLSRPYFPWADIPFNRDPAIRSLLARTKKMLDPENVLQPGAMSLGQAA